METYVGWADAAAVMAAYGLQENPFTGAQHVIAIAKPDENYHWVFWQDANGDTWNNQKKDPDTFALIWEPAPCSRADLEYVLGNAKRNNYFGVGVEAEFHAAVEAWMQATA